MSTPEELLRGFTFEPGLDQWETERQVPCWGGTLPVRIAAPAGGPSPQQVEVLRAVLARPGDLRGEVEQAVFGYYKQNVEETTGYFERGADVTALRAADLHRPGLPCAHTIWPGANVGKDALLRWLADSPAGWPKSTSPKRQIAET
jgi:hypothetical protein